MAPASSLCYWGAHGVLIALMVSTNFVLLPIIFQMLAYTGAILYIGCHHSLKMFEKDPETGEQQEVESVSKKDAMMFPIFGSVALFSMFVAFKFFGKEWVNFLVTTYLTVIGVVALAESIRPLLCPFFTAAMNKRSTKVEFRVPYLMKEEDDPVSFSFGKTCVVAYLLAAMCSAGYLYTKHWTFHNLFGISFSLQAVAIISLSRFNIAFVLLAGLFLYDIFWVFGTNVMVAVATNFQGPIKIIFPVSFDPWKQSILGLGDIVIPGIFIAMTLRFDAFRYKQSLKPVESKTKTGEGKDNADEKEAEEVALDEFSTFPKPYFWAVFVAYLLGLLTTGFVMFAFEAAQPALLYLVPFTIAAVVGTSLVRGEFGVMQAYNEEDLKPKKEEGAKDGEEKKDDTKDEKKTK